MNPIDLVYLDSIGSILDRLAAEKQAALASGADDRAGELDRRIAELSARRQRMTKRMFGIVPVVAS
ncbi:MAG TPA: hypothetical protein VHU15_01070 [Stellaceae bacterium]|jgi:hypothetical protein|nr:hypothetical protein [Stellaceae bacterium]